MRSIMREHPLRIYRTSHKLTQGQLGSLLGVSDATITHIENGRRPVTPENAIKWEAKTGISRADLCPEIFGDKCDCRAEPERPEIDREAA